MSWFVVVAVAALAGGVVARPEPAIGAQAGCDAAPERVILTVGDSITEGATMTSSVSASYRAELGRLLDEACVPHQWVVAGVGGTPCGYWSPRIADLMATYRPNIVLIACGTNDRLLGKSAAEVTAWEGMYRALFDAVLDADPNVLAFPAFVQYSASRTATGCTTPPGFGPPWLPNSEAVINDALFRSMRVIDEWGQRVPEFIDYQPIPEGYLDQCGVHPTPGGYDVMGRLAFARIAPQLGVPAAPLPCGLTGTRPGGGLPDWIPCERMAVN